MYRKYGIFIFFCSLVIVALLLAACNTKTSDASPTLKTPPSTLSPVAAGVQRLIVLPDDGPDAVLELIDGAQKSIRFKIYLLTYYDARAALIRAANRGVDVRVLIEKELTGGGASNAESYQILQEGGVHVKWAPKTFRLVHEKSLVIDDLQAMIATYNFTNSSFSRNREYAVITTQPDVVADVATIFDADWSGEGILLDKKTPLVVSPENSRQRLLQLIDGANASLWLEQSTLLDDEIVERLLTAVNRGVAVRFIGPNRGDDDVAYENLQKLADAGADVGRLGTPYVHAKVILSDDSLAFVGSENMTFSSLNLNRELGIVTKDKAIVDRLRDSIIQDWKHVKQVTSTVVLSTPEGVLDWEEAELHVGQVVTVEGKIVRGYDSGKVTLLNFDQDYHNTLTVVIFPSLYDQFPQPPARYFDGHTVRVTGEVKLYEGAPEIVIESASQIEMLDAPSRASASADVSTRAGPGIDTSKLDAENGADGISWQKAGDYLGQEVAVKGEVVRTYNSGKVTFLNFDQSWKGKFSVVIFASDYPKFPESPDGFYLNKTIVVTGTVKEYKGAPEIIVDNPGQIQIVEGDGTSRDLVTPAEHGGVVAWQDAAAYVGQTITVEGRIVQSKDIGSMTFLDFSKQKNSFVAIVWADDYDKFSQPPARLYANKKVWITGEIVLYKGKPEIIIRDPRQVEVFD